VTTPLQLKQQLALAAAETARRRQLNSNWQLYLEWGESRLIRSGGGGRFVAGGAARGSCIEWDDAAAPGGLRREINPPELAGLALPPVGGDWLDAAPAAGLPDECQLLLASRRVALARQGQPAVIEHRRHWELHRRGGEIQLGADGAGLRAALRAAAQPPARLDWRAGLADRLIFAPPAAGVLLHELAGHPLECDHPLSRTLRAGTQLLPLPLTITDEPRRAGSGLELAVDDEGEATATKTLVKAGRVADFLATRRDQTAGRAAHAGNARREDYLSPALPRASVMVAQGGEQSAAELLGGRGRRLLIERLNGHGRGETVTLRAESAVLLEQGEPGERLRPFTLRWKRRDLAAALEGASAEISGPHGALCEKSGQRVPIICYAPWLAVRL
jgi:hypothetical protein